MNAYPWAGPRPGLYATFRSGTIQVSIVFSPLVAGFTSRVDQHVRESGKRSDLGEMAQHAASETLAVLAGRELPSLLGSTAPDP
jgi:hypothetical protein